MRGPLTALAALMLTGCAGDLVGPFMPFAMQSLAVSNEVAAPTPAPPSPIVVQSTPMPTPTTTPAPSASPSIVPVPLPSAISLPADLLPSVDETITGSEYLAADFTCEYPATWSPYPSTREELARGQVMWVESDYNMARVEAYAFKAVYSLEEYFSVLMQGAEDKVETAMVPLDGEKGFQIQGKHYYNGEELGNYTLGFVVGDRFIMIKVQTDPSSKDKEILDKEIASVFGTWKWKK